MRTITLSCCTVVLMTLTFGKPAVAQDAGGLHFVAAVNEYYRVEYVAPPAPPALDVVFAGEPVQLRLEVGNRNFAAEALTTSGASITEAFSLKVIRAPKGATTPTLTVGPTGRIIGEGENDISWGDDIGIPPRSRVVFKGAIATTRSAIPGVYEVRITPNLQTRSKLNLLGTIVRFEIRVASTFADEVEMMRRHMTREYYHDNTAAAETAADALLARYPQSAAAYRMKGLLAAAKGNRKEAIEALGKARELLATRQDELRRTQEPNDLPRTLKDLTQRIDAIAKNAPARER